MAQVLFANPKARRPRKTRAKARRRSTGIAKRVGGLVRARRRSYRRNPLPKIGNVMTTFTGGAIGAAGAIGVDFVMGKLPLPAQLQTGPLNAITKGLVGIGVGMAIAKVGKNKRIGEQVAQGAVTVALYEAGKKAFNLGDVSDAGLLGYDNTMLGYTDIDDGLGWQSAAPVFDIDGYQDY